MKTSSKVNFFLILLFSGLFHINHGMEESRRESVGLPTQSTRVKAIVDGLKKIAPQLVPDLMEKIILEIITDDPTLLPYQKLLILFEMMRDKKCGNPEQLSDYIYSRDDLSMQPTRSPLDFAVYKNGRERRYDLSISFLRTRDRTTMRLLCDAIKRKDESEVTRLLNEEKVNPNYAAKYPQNNGREYPLLVAVYSTDSIFNLLLNSGANPNIPNSFGKTPLFYVTTRYDMPKIKALMQAGADATLKDNDERTALDYVPSAPEDMRQLLLRKKSD